MHKVKSHKSVEQIAKKHRLEVSFVKRQLEMGIPIEHEHTKDKDLATDIALQHLDEIPDYYTRLKKMEADAKKHHKRFKDVNEATDGIGAKSKNYSLHKWFDDGGWVQAGGKYDGKPCAKQPGQKTKPYCRDPDDRKNMSKEERNKRSINKRLNDPNPNRSGKAKMVTQESAGEKDACYTKVKSRYKIWPSAYASGALVKCRKVGAKNWGTKSEATEMVRYCPKCKKDETRNECKYGAKYWDMFSVPSALTTNQLKYNIATVHPGNFPESYDHEHSMARSELSTIISAAKRLRKKMKGEGNIEAWVQSKITKASDYLDSAADYMDSGEHKISEGSKLGDKLEIKGGTSPYKNPVLPGEQRATPQSQEPNLNVPTGERLLKQAKKDTRKLQVAHYDYFPEQVADTDSPPDYSNFDTALKSIRKKGSKLTSQQKVTALKQAAKLRPVDENKSFTSFMIEAIDKSKMKCNSPKSDPVGDSLTGKSHVVKACAGGTEKIIRFGQRGVKGSPKKKGESEAYRNRRLRFKARHKKNISKGKMSAAYWADKVKW